MSNISSPRLGGEEILGRLVAFDSTSRNSNLPIADWVCDLLDRPGVRIERWPSPDATKTNVVVTVGPEVDPATRAGFALSGHFDVVPAEEPGWTSHPFTLTDRGDRWVGRGACDMKGFVALAVELAGGLDPAGLRHPLVLILTYDEEVGTLGARRLAETWPRDRPLPRRTIVGEPTSLRAVRLHKGHARARLRFAGVAAHSGYPHLGKNAIEPAAQAIVALAELRRRLETETCPNAEHFPEVPFVALNVAQVEGGTAINIVPDHCTVEIGFRVLPGMVASTLADRLEAAVDAALGEEPFTFERGEESPPMLLADDNDLYRDLCAALDQRETVSASYATDAGWLQQLGLDCLLFGPGTIAVAHKPDESLPKAEFERAREVLRTLATRYCAA